MPSQDVAVELYYDGAWHDIVADDAVLAGAPITITRGQGDESASLRPTSITARFDNGDDRYRITNPCSPLYGKAGRNTPVRVSVGGVVRGVANASSWAPDQSSSFRATPRRGTAWVDMEAGGLLQRVAQWSKPPQSPMYRYLTRRTDLTDYWPGYDTNSSTTIASATGGRAAHATDGFKLDTTFGVGDSPAGSAGSFQIGQDSALVGDATPTSDGNWTAVWAFRLTAAVDPLAAGMPLFKVELSQSLWSATVYVFPEDYNLEVSNPTTVGVDRDVTYDQGDEPTQWVLMALSATNSGGTTNLRWSWYPQGGTVRTFTDSFASGPLPPLDWRINSNDNIAGAQFSEIALLSTSSLFTIDSDLQEAFDGYAGETAAARFARLMDEQGLPYQVSPTTASSMPMGAQRTEPLPDLLAELVRTEDGLLFETVDTNELFFLTRHDRYNQTPALTLTPGDLPALPREVADDLFVHNVVTAQQRDGGSATARDDESPLGTQDPPDGVGEYLQTIDVNLAVENLVLPQVAAWWLCRGTVDLPRYPQLVVNLAALDAATVAAVEAVDIGSVIKIDNFREDDTRLIVLGSVETIGTHSRRIAFSCVPDQPFQVAVYDDTVRRYDSRSSTLNRAYGPADTSLLIQFDDTRDAWSQTSVPYDWQIAGERVTVTAVSGVTGAGPYFQTATVRRSVNGVVKRQLAGAAVHMHPDQQARYAL